MRKVESSDPKEEISNRVLITKFMPRSVKKWVDSATKVDNYSEQSLLVGIIMTPFALASFYGFICSPFLNYYGWRVLSACGIVPSYEVKAVTLLSSTIFGIYKGFRKGLNLSGHLFNHLEQRKKPPSKKGLFISSTRSKQSSLRRVD